MSTLAALVLALLGALGTAWAIWLRREHERDIEALAQQVAILANEVNALRSSMEATREQVAALHAATDTTHAELVEFVHGPPSLRSPTPRA
ncbi:MAG: hypothetical protein U0441_08285 [Polyangiaceae bacterium]